MASQILAVSGVLGDGVRSRGLISYATSLAGVDRPVRLCFIPTAEGDNPLVLKWFAESFGNDPAIEPSVLTLFTKPNVPDVRKHLLAQDVVWVGGGSVVNLDAFSNGLGWLPWSNGVHDDLADQPRRTTYRRLVAEGALPGGYATEDGVGLHYVDGEFHEAVTVLPGKRAWWVEGNTERAITARVLHDATG
jgi:peptidase E